MTSLAAIEQDVPKLRERFICGDVEMNDITNWIKYQSKLEEEAPYGRCCLCNLALERRDSERGYHSDMHENCMYEHYGD